jgi:hypothetical protein
MQRLKSITVFNKICEKVLKTLLAIFIENIIAKALKNFIFNWLIEGPIPIVWINMLFTDGIDPMVKFF